MSGKTYYPVIFISHAGIESRRVGTFQAVALPTELPVREFFFLNNL